MKLLILSLILICINISADIDTITVGKDTKNISVLENASLLLDKQSQLNISKVLQKDREFTPVRKKVINYGYIFADTLWIKFTLYNSSDKEILKYLVFDSPTIDIINLYFKKDEKIESFKEGVFAREAFESELAFSFPLSLNPHETITYYLELKAMTHSLHFNLSIKDYKTFKNEELHHQLILTIFFAVLFVIMISNAVIFINTKDTVYIYYSFFVFTLFIHHLFIRGMIGYFLPASQDIITLQAYMPVYNLALVLVAMFLFVKKFLNLQNHKKLYFIFKVLLSLSLIITLLHSKENYILNYLTPLALLFALYLEFMGFYLFIKTQERNAKYFFIIWSISLAGMIGTILYYVGILPNAVPYLFEITVTVEVLLFSIVLASQIKELQNEKFQKDKIILEQSKLSSMGEMLQNIAHQWRQPLSEINAVTMKIDADFYQKNLDALSLEKDIVRIEDITSHLSSTIESFSTYFRTDKQLELTTVEYILDKALNIMHGGLQDIVVHKTIEYNAKININVSELIQVILVILNNAVDALEENRTKDKKILIRIMESENHVLLEIEDNAGGIKEENLTKVFEPYFSTKFKAQGIGIGLYMAKKIIQESLKGTVVVQNSKNGARFTIQLWKN